MRWFRSNIESAAWVALAAMALQLALAFGHLHLRIGSIQQVAKAAVTLPDGSSLPTKQKPRIVDERCAVCTLIQVAGTGVPAAGASLPIPVRFLAAHFRIGIEHEPDASSPRHFQARGPPWPDIDCA
jgi:hypothetical protein